MRYPLAAWWARLWRRPVLAAWVECSCGRCHEVRQYDLVACRCGAKLWIEGGRNCADMFARVPLTYPWGERSPVVQSLRYTQPGPR